MPASLLVSGLIHSGGLLHRRGGLSSNLGGQLRSIAAHLWQLLEVAVFGPPPRGVCPLHVVGLSYRPHSEQEAAAIQCTKTRMRVPQEE